MTKRIFAILLAIIICATLLSACKKEDKSGENESTATTVPVIEPYSFPEDADVLAGSWTVTAEDGASMNFFFNGSGRGAFTSLGRMMKMAYEIDGDEVIVVVYYEETEDVHTTVFTYEVNGDKLSLTTDGLTQVFTRDPWADPNS